MSNSHDNPYAILKPSAGNLLGITLVTFLIMLINVGFLQLGVDKLIGDFRSAFLVDSLLQSVLAFIFPVFLATLLCCRRPMAYLGLDAGLKPSWTAGVIILFFLMIPAMNFLVEWNADLTLPSSMSAIEEQFREWEDSAAKTTSGILDDSSVWGLVSGIIVIGCITGFAEEILFRGGIQRALVKGGCNAHIAIWSTAFIFSLVHFQFFGFVPRLIFGATFGYLYYYTGSLWTAAFAHALNNSMVVIESWLLTNGFLTANIDTLGTMSENQWWLALASCCITLLFILVPGRYFFQSRNLHNSVIND